MYVGCAGLMIPQIQRSRENQNSLMGLCTVGAGAVLSVGLGSLASRIFDKTVDKIVDFWDDVKPSGAANKPEEGKADG